MTTRKTHQEILNDEIAGDELGRGYAAMTDTEVRVDMTAKTRPAKNGALISSEEVRASTTIEQYDALTSPDKEDFWRILSLELINADTLDGILLERILGANSLDPFRLAKQIIREEELEIPAFVTEGRVSNARGGPTR